MPTDLIPAHSIAEAYLWVMINPCDVCVTGPREPSLAPGASAPAVRLMAVCRNCGASDAFRLPQSTDAQTEVDPLSASGPVNPTDEPSRIIDVVQWVSLHQRLLESADETPDATERRWRRHRARECLEEALRFYGGESDIPPESAFFADRSRDSFRSHPQRYTRQRLLALRDRLPHVDTHPADRSEPRRSARRPWWRFWS